MVRLAPREVQQTHKLLNTGWALATVDNRTSGLIPINYVRRFDANGPAKTESMPGIIAGDKLNEAGDILETVDTCKPNANGQNIDDGFISEQVQTSQTGTIEDVIE